MKCECPSVCHTPEVLALVRGGSSASNLLEPSRTTKNHIIAEIARCVEFFHMSLGWFDCTERSLTTSLQGQQGVQGADRGVARGVLRGLKPPLCPQGALHIGV